MAAGPSAGPYRIGWPLSNRTTGGNLAAFLGGPETTVTWGATAGALTGLGWVALSIATIALFERRSLAYMAINGGCFAVAFTVMGAILGAWRDSYDKH